MESRLLAEQVLLQSTFAGNFRSVTKNAGCLDRLSVPICRSESAQWVVILQCKTERVESRVAVVTRWLATVSFQPLPNGLPTGHHFVGRDRTGISRWRRHRSAEDSTEDPVSAFDRTCSPRSRRRCEDGTETQQASPLKCLPPLDSLHSAGVCIGNRVAVMRCQLRLHEGIVRTEDFIDRTISVSQ